MSIYQKEYTLLSTDVDLFQRLRLSRLFTWMQEAAIAHTTELGMGRDKTLDKGLLWIITLTRTEIERLPVYDEPVTLRSWPGKTMHMFFPRYSTLTDASGQVLVRSSMFWGLMDQSTRHLVFPEDHGIEIEGDSAPAPLPLPAPLKMPPAAQTGTFTVPYSYIDLNGHMNNTRYLDLAEDRMPDSLRALPVREIRTEYDAEASLREEIRLEASAGPDAVAMAGYGEKRLFRLTLKYDSE